MNYSYYNNFNRIINICQLRQHQGKITNPGQANRWEKRLSYNDVTLSYKDDEALTKVLQYMTRVTKCWFV